MPRAATLYRAARSSQKKHVAASAARALVQRIKKLRLILVRFTPVDEKYFAIDETINAD
jgi:hypothetical protein